MRESPRASMNDAGVLLTPFMDERDPSEEASMR